MNVCFPFNNDYNVASLLPGRGPYQFVFNIICVVIALAPMSDT